MRACLWWIWNQRPKKMFGYNSSAIKPSVNRGNQGLTARHTNIHASAQALTLYHTRPPRNTSVCLQGASSHKCPCSKSSLSFNSSLNSQADFQAIFPILCVTYCVCIGHKMAVIRKYDLVTDHCSLCLLWSTDWSFLIFWVQCLLEQFEH